jgi:hypothetical protein
VHACQDFVKQTIFGGVGFVVLQRLEVGFIHAAILVRCKRHVGPDTGEPFVDGVLGLIEISAE